ncbi:hypothetical protein A3F64_03170 [Candidatus Saccharibacteria bacterium RIFCSPHIGHO2_12_FULL_42_8]|nr:MAG: hypothetical protein A3F64_03170 [Candidatus Saccharibacteria bacterium RIFCSPHIGHO2_12_FULL_42_8]
MEQDPKLGRIVKTPLAVRNYDEFGYMCTQRGVRVEGLTDRGDVVYQKKVFQRGAYLPFRPFYEKRVNRASKKARRALGVLATSN